MSERRDLVTVRLLEIYDRDGKLTAEQVLHDATSPSGSIHDWHDDGRWAIRSALTISNTSPSV